VLRSESPVLIDTAYISGIEDTAEILKRLGVSVSEVSLIVNTHTHCDHIGANRFIQKRSGCDIALHKIGKHFIDSRDDWATWWRYFDQEAEFFRCTRALIDGDILFLGPHEFQVIYTPGHASDGIVLYNRNERLLFSSDTLWEKDMGVMTVRIEGSTALFRMLESVEKLSSLDVKTVYPGHGGPFQDFEGAVGRARKRLKRFIDDPQSTGDDLLKKIFVYTLLIKRKVPEADIFPYLMRTHWFRETVDLYFDGRYEAKYGQIVETLLKKGIIELQEGMLTTTVNP